MKKRVKRKNEVTEIARTELLEIGPNKRNVILLGNFYGGSALFVTFNLTYFGEWKTSLVDFIRHWNLISPFLF